MCPIFRSYVLAFVLLLFCCFYTKLLWLLRPVNPKSHTQRSVFTIEFIEYTFDFLFFCLHLFSRLVQPLSILHPNGRVYRELFNGRRTLTQSPIIVSCCCVADGRCYWINRNPLFDFMLCSHKNSCSRIFAFYPWKRFSQWEFHGIQIG